MACSRSSVDGQVRAKSPFSDSQVRIILLDPQHAPVEHRAPLIMLESHQGAGDGFRKQSATR